MIDHDDEGTAGTRVLARALTSLQSWLKCYCEAR